MEVSKQCIKPCPNSSSAAPLIRTLQAAGVIHLVYSRYQLHRYACFLVQACTWRAWSWKEKASFVPFCQGVGMGRHPAQWKGHFLGNSHRHSPHPTSSPPTYDMTSAHRRPGAHHMTWYIALHWCIWVIWVRFNFDSWHRTCRHHTKTLHILLLGPFLWTTTLCSVQQFSFSFSIFKV